MNILGISALDNMASVALVCDGTIAAAISEERLTRVKLQAGFPNRALDEALRIAGLKESDIDLVTYPFHSWRREAFEVWTGLLRNIVEEARGPTDPASKLRHLARYTKWSLDSTGVHRRYHRELKRELVRRGLYDKLERVEHHQTHAASAYLTSGADEAIVATLDWYGGGLAGSISLARPNGIKRLKSIRFPHSMGMFYAYVTLALKFKPARHEGKIVGLAAYGDPTILFKQVRERFTVRDGDLKFHSGADLRFVHDLAARYPREHVAAAYQAVLEDVVVELITHYVRTTGIKSVVLAGGVTANVKMNQRIFEIEGVDHIFIHPAMGDEGTGTGGALDAAFRRGEVSSTPIEHVYLGPEYSEDEMRRCIESHGYTPQPRDDIEKEIARRLAAGEVIAHFDGRMEYGPRALGNRSILCHPGDPTINDWLNKRLQRTEFMPFAPVSRVEEAEACYKGIRGFSHAARFMTITCDCTEKMKTLSPAAVHIDGTARPQLVDPEHGGKIHRILTHYVEMTGIPAIINTSFNMHEEPIVCTPDDALRAFRQSGLEALVMGRLLVEQHPERIKDAKSP